MGHRLAAIEMGRKMGGAAVPMFGHSWATICHNVAWAEAYLRTKWHLDPSSRLATTDMGQKLGLCPFFGGARSSYNTMSPGPSPTCVPSGILIHPTVWPQ